MSEKLEWIDADGTTVTLHDPADLSTTAVMFNVSGMFSPSFSHHEDDVPLVAGTVLRDVEVLPRTVIIPLKLYSTTEAGLRTAVRNRVAQLDPIRGDGTLRWTDSTSASRDLTCRLRSGTEGEIRPSTHTNQTGNWSQILVLEFRAHDPYWYATSTSQQTFTTGGTATFFPFFPLTLSGSEVFDEVSVNNTGDVEAFPVWTVTGPGDDPILRNVTDSKLIDLTGVSLAAGDVLTIDTRPGVKTVTLDDGTNHFGSMTSASSLWSLPRGTSTVRVELSNADADSSVVMTYTRRYLSA